MPDDSNDKQTNEDATSAEPMSEGDRPSAVEPADSGQRGHGQIRPKAVEDHRLIAGSEPHDDNLTILRGDDDE